MPYPSNLLMLKWLIYLSLAGSACEAAPLEIWDCRPARNWKQAFSFLQGPLGCRMLGGVPEESLGLFNRSPGFDSLSPRVADLGLRWLGGGSVTGYRRSLDLSTGIATVTFERNGARITETVFLSRVESALVVHLRADKPGALDFEVALAPAAKIKDRRELVANGLRVWVLPFESDVEPSPNGGLAVKGEGEAMILLAAGKEAGVADRFRALGTRYDQRDLFPDLTKVWAGLLESQKSPLH